MLIGHDKEWQQLLADTERGTLAHGLLISGPRGIGKATLAYRLAHHLLCAQGADPVAVERRMEAGSHSDFLVVKQEMDPKKDELKQEISVEQARKVAQFLSMTPGESSWRVVIMDSVDHLNVNAANAILKILEEPPPQSVLMLVSHSPGRLLPTIRSRCRSLKLSPLTQDSFNQVMREQSPHIDVFERESLALLSDYSPGVAMVLSQAGAMDQYQALLSLIKDLPQINSTGLHMLAERIASGSTHQNWQVFSHVSLTLLSRLSKKAAGLHLKEIAEGEREVLARASQLHLAATWAIKWQQTSEQFLLAESRHLDYKQVMIAWFYGLIDNNNNWLLTG